VRRIDSNPLRVIEASRHLFIIMQQTTTVYRQESEVGYSERSCFRPSANSESSHLAELPHPMHNLNPPLSASGH